MEKIDELILELESAIEYSRKAGLPKLNYEDLIFCKTQLKIEIEMLKEKS